MSINPTWESAQRRISAMLHSHYRLVRDVEIVEMPGAPRPVVERPDTVFIAAHLLDSPQEPAPSGSAASTTFQLQQPRLFGGIATELAHHRYSPWRGTVENSTTEPDSQDMAAAVKLDAVRAQARAAADNPACQPMMRTYRSAMTLAPDLDDRALLELALVEGPLRHAGGLAGGTEVDPLMDLLPEILGEQRWALHQELAQELLREPGTNPASMLALGKVWRRIVADTLAAGDLPAGDVDLALDRSMRRSANGGADAIGVWRVKYPPPLRRRPPEVMATTMEEWANILDPDGDVTLGRGDDPGADILPTHRRIVYRDPTPAERDTSHALSVALGKVRYRSPRNTTDATGIPVGRLNTRELVQATAQRTMGVTVTASPWNRPIRESVTQPGLACAIVFDASDSMRVFRDPLASATWAMSHAVATIGGTVTTWGFGGNAFETIRQHTTPTQVPVVVDKGSQSDAGPVALARAAAGARLLAASGARLAMMLTDAALPDGDLRVIEEQFARLENDGVVCVMVKLGALGRKPKLAHGKVVECVSAADLEDVILGEVVDTLASA